MPLKESSFDNLRSSSDSQLVLKHQMHGNHNIREKRRRQQNTNKKPTLKRSSTQNKEAPYKEIEDYKATDVHSTSRAVIHDTVSRARIKDMQSTVLKRIAAQELNNEPNQQALSSDDIAIDTVINMMAHDAGIDRSSHASGIREQSDLNRLEALCNTDDPKEVANIFKALIRASQDQCMKKHKLMNGFSQVCDEAAWPHAIIPYLESGRSFATGKVVKPVIMVENFHNKDSGNKETYVNYCMQMVCAIPTSEAHRLKELLQHDEAKHCVLNIDSNSIYSDELEEASKYEKPFIKHDQVPCDPLTMKEAYLRVLADINKPISADELLIRCTKDDAISSINELLESGTTDDNVINTMLQQLTTPSVQMNNISKDITVCNIIIPASFARYREPYHNHREPYNIHFDQELQKMNQELNENDSNKNDSNKIALLSEVQELHHPVISETDIHVKESIEALNRVIPYSNIQHSINKDVIKDQCKAAAKYYFTDQKEQAEVEHRINKTRMSNKEAKNLHKYTKELNIAEEMNKVHNSMDKNQVELMYKIKNLPAPTDIREYIVEETVEQLPEQSLFTLQEQSSPVYDTEDHNDQININSNQVSKISTDSTQTRKHPDSTQARRQQIRGLLLSMVANLDDMPD